MKRMLWVLAMAGLFVAGCGKNKTAPPPEYNQVTVDLPKLQNAFAEAGPEAKQSVAMVQRNLRYGDYPKALMSLDELVNNTSITEAQKKVVNEVIEQVKKVINQNQAQPPPAQ